MSLIPRYDARTRTPLQGISGRAQAFPLVDPIGAAISGVGEGLGDLARGMETGDRLNEIKAQREAAAKAKAQDSLDEDWWTGQAPNTTLAITQGVNAARSQAPEDGKGYADNVLKVVDETFQPYEAQATTPKAKELVAKAKASARERFGTGALDYQNQALQTWRGAQVDKAEQSGLEAVRTAPVDMLGDLVKTQVEAYGATLAGLDPVERVKRQAGFGAKMADAAYERRVLDEADRTGKVTQGAVGDTVERIIGREGEAFVANDNGAPSKFGIRATEPGGKRNGKLVADLTRDEARAIYLDEYAAPMGLSETAIAAHPAFAEVALDAAVNHGVEKAKAMVAQAGGDWRKLVTLREAEYRRLAAANPAKYGDDLNGWLNRMGALTKDAAALDTHGPDMVTLLASPEAKAKAIEAGTKLVEQKNNLRRGELSIAIERGQAGPEAIARGVKEGWIQEGSPDWTALTKASDEAAKKAADAAQLQARVNQAVTQGVPLDPHNNDDRKGMNADFDARAAGWKPEDWSAQAVRYARQVGMVPDSLKGRVVGGLRSSNPDARLAASKVYADLKANAPQAVREFSDDDVRDANLMLSYARMGMTPKEATDAIAFGQKLTPEDKAGRDRAFTAGLGPKGAAADQFLAQAINRDKDVQGARGFLGGGFTPPVEMMADFKNAAQLAYRRTGDMDASMHAAYDQISRAWGPSVFNGDRTFVKNAPEVTYGLHGLSADDNAKWIRRQLADQLGEHGDAKALRLIESPLQKAGRPVYYVMKEGEGGALAPVSRDGQPLYFQPEWNTSPTKKDQDTKARKAREEEMQKALMTRQRLGVRAQQLLDQGTNPVARAGGG